MPSPAPRHQPTTKNSLTKEQKHHFFRLLKQLLETPSSLEDGIEAQVQHDGKTLVLAYWTKICKVTVQNARGQIQLQEIVPIGDIYLRWCQGFTEEPLSPESLQRVQNELKLLGMQNEEIKACFSLARIKFTQELQCLQRSTTLKVICDDVILSFASGKGENMATVLYDSIRNKPIYSINVANEWVRTGRWFWTVLCGVGALFAQITDTLSAFESLVNLLTVLMKSTSPLLETIILFIRSKIPHHQRNE